MKDLIEKRRSGNALSDEELDNLIAYYSNLTSLLKEQGERGHIYWYYSQRNVLIDKILFFS